MLLTKEILGEPITNTMALHKPVKKSEEKELAKDKELLVLSNLRIVLYALKGVGCDESFIEDVLQEGFIGLMNAAELFDPDKNVKFITYAFPAVLRKMRRFVSQNNSIVKWPISVSSVLYAKNMEGGHYLTPGEGRVRTLDRVFDRKNINGDTYSKSNEVLDTTTEVMILDRLITKETVESVLTFAENMGGNYKEIVIQRFGLDGNGEKTFQEIGDALGVSKQAVQAAEAKFIKAAQELFKQA